MVPGNAAEALDMDVVHRAIDERWAPQLAHGRSQHRLEVDLVRAGRALADVRTLANDPVVVSRC